MMKKLLFTSAMVLLCTFMFANPVTLVDAKDVAVKYYKYIANTNITDYSVANSYTTQRGGVAVYYVFTFNAGGFVMVSADDAIIPVLGYSDEGTFDVNQIPVNAQNFFDSYATEITKIVGAQLSNVETKVKWDVIKTENFSKSANVIVGPLLGTNATGIKWDQGTPYNNLAPGGTPTGCVATAMSQIMKFWSYPTTGTGQHSYVHATYGTLSANFGTTTYQWASMINSYAGAYSSGQGNAVATLMYQAGVSVNMDYEPAGSGAFTQNVPPAFINYFNYQPSAEVKSRSSFPTDISWYNLITEEINEGRPCMLSGDNQGAAGSGHEWVCDGYNSGTGLCHMNWGWGTYATNYFALTNLNPNGDIFNSDRQAVIRITPLSAIKPIANFSIDGSSTIIPAIGAPVGFTDLSLNSPTSWLWTFDGGTPATSNSQNPTGVTFATNGYHIISLKVTNANGSDIKTKERYIKVGGAPTVWIKQNSGFTVASRGIDQIQILDANTVWAKAYDGTNPVGYIREFTKTTNGGITWTPGSITFTNAANYGCANIFAFDNMNAHACMFPITGTGGTIVKTTDGGATWNTEAGATFTTSWADFVHFFDSNNGVCVGDPTATTGTDFFIYTTSNGGTSWTQVPVGNIPNSISGEAGIVNEYYAVGNTIWFTSNKGRCFKSTNMGANWTVATTGFTTSYQMQFKDALVGIAVSDTLPYSMRKTTDGGLTWAALNSTGFVVRRPQIAFIPGTTSTWVDVASFPSNGSTYSSNDGTSFVNIDSGSVQFTSVGFFDVNTGWAGSFNVSSTDDGIYKWNPSVLGTTGINNNHLTDGNIAIFPVPSTGIVNVQLGKITDEAMTITVYDVVGAKVMNKQVRAISNDIILLDLSDKVAGLYFVNITNGGKTVSKKIVIR